MITDNLSSHTSVTTRTRLVDHPRIRQVFIPKGACWLNLQEAWWRLFAARRWPANASPTPPRSHWLPGSRAASSTSAPDRGSGVARHRHRATGSESLCTAFEERSTSSRSLRQRKVRANRRTVFSRSGGILIEKLAKDTTCERGRPPDKNAKSILQSSS